MFPPIPAAFNGSTPQDFSQQDTGASLAAQRSDFSQFGGQDAGPLARLPRLLGLSFGALALLGAATVCVGTVLSGAHPAWPDVVKLACAALLVPALLGMWLVEQVTETPSLAVTRIYSLVQQHLQAEDGATAVARHLPEGSYAGLAGLIAHSVAQVRRLQAARVRSQDLARASNQALRTGRDQAARLATHLRNDSAAIADAASGIMAASARLAEEATNARKTSQDTEHTVSRIVNHAGDLATGVAAITTQISEMTAVAVCASEAAFGAQATLASLGEKNAALSRTMEQVKRALQLAGACGQAASHQAVRAGTAGVGADLAANLQEMTRCAEGALASMQDTVAGLRVETRLAGHRVAELSELIRAQSEVGLGLSHAIERQGAEVAQVLALLQEAHAGFARMRIGVDAATQQGTNRLAEAEAVRGAASRLPAHADTIAGILRAIPDFAPPVEF